MTQDQMKRAVAQAAIDYIAPKLKPDDVLGIGTGSTTNYFVDLLADYKMAFAGAVSSSKASAERLQSHGIRLVDLNDAGRLRLYVDGADESNEWLHLIKGGGAALTREKIVAACADEFICIADQSKWVKTLGAFPLPVEVIPMARRHVMAALTALGGRPVHRAGVMTDNGGEVLDVHGLSITDAPALEREINQITGVITNGLFAVRPADLMLLGTEDGVRHIEVTGDAQH